MPVFESIRGGRIDLSLPASDWPELQKVASDYETLRRERKVTNSRLRSLEREREKAVEADRLALAEAIRKGKKGGDAGAKEADRIDREIAACNRRLEALEEALDMVENDVLLVVDEHREAWITETSALHDEARQEYAEAVERLSTARDSVSQRFALLYWLTHFPSEEMGAVSYRVRGSYLPSLRASHGDPYTFAEVASALRGDAQARPEPGRLLDPVAEETQRLHEERVENEHAGRGYFTDEELARRSENPLTFEAGAGAKLLTPRYVERDDEPARAQRGRPVATEQGIVFPARAVADDE